MSAGSWILDTRPALNFLSVDRIALLTQLLGSEITVPPTVVIEIRNYVDWTRRDVQRRARFRPESVEPAEVIRLENLERWQRRLRAAAVRRLDALDIGELETVGHYLATGALDPGESEALAVAKHRGFIVIIDEFVGHCRAESEHIPNTSTLGVLVDAVKNQQIDETEAAQVWASIQECWDYAPPGPLAITCTEARSGRRAAIEVRAIAVMKPDPPGPAAHRNQVHTRHAEVRLPPERLAQVMGGVSLALPVALPLFGALLLSSTSLVAPR